MIGNVSKTRLAGVLLGVVLLVPRPALAQERFASWSGWVKTTPAYLASGCRSILGEPSNRILLGSVALGTWAAYQIDREVQAYAQEEGLLAPDLSRLGDLYGGFWAHWILYGAITATSWGEADLVPRLDYAWWAVSSSATLTSILKLATGRQRPDRSNTRSFPSGHTSHSFAVAAVARELFGPRVGRPAYTLAAIVALSRIQDNKHHLSDVLFGAGLGTLVGRGLAIPYRSNRKRISLRPRWDGTWEVAVQF